MSENKIRNETVIRKGKRKRKTMDQSRKLKEQMQLFEKQLEGLKEDVQSLKNSSRKLRAEGKAPTDEERSSEEDQQLEERWISSMLRIRDTFAGKKGGNNYNRTRNVNDERRRISEDTELCVVWKFDVEIAIREHYAFLHDFLLYYLDANVRYDDTLPARPHPR